MRNLMSLIAIGAAAAALAITPSLGQGGGSGAGQGAGQQDRDRDTTRDIDRDLDSDMDRDRDRDRNKLADQDRDRLYFGAQDRLREHDRDRDGFLSETEFRAWRESQFGAIDSDGNGGFGLQEYLALRYGPGPKAGVATKNLERATLRKTERFRLMDGDGDGVVTHTEFMKFGELNYLEADANDDGKLMFKELNQYHRNE